MTESDLQHNSATISRSRRIFIWTIRLLVLVLVIGGGWFAYYGFTPGPANDAKTVVVTIPKGTSVRGISEILAHDGIIRADIRFLLLAKVSGYGSRLQAGEFLLHTGMKPGAVLRELAFARSIEYSITIPEGLRAAEIAEIFGESGLCDPQRFLKFVSDASFIEKLGFDRLDSLEGYLFPDTYLLTRDMGGAENIIPIMVKRFNDVWGELSAGLKEKPDLEETVILASIVEKETGAPEERPLIAGVFRNRLQLGMRLQSDPTVVYGSNKFTGSITRADLQTPTLYNTYTRSGLPFGPICNPGKEALKAVLHPASTKDLYFVSKNNGTHYFSTTLAEHNNAVQKYQRNNSGKKGKTDTEANPQ